MINDCAHAPEFSVSTVSMEHVAILGAGAMGCLFGARLREAGCAVTFVVRRPETASSLGKNGVRLDPPVREGDSGESAEAGEPEVSPKTVTGFGATTDYAAVRDASLVLVLVRASATAAVAASLAPHIGPETLVLSLQNGLGNIEALIGRLPKGQVAAGITGNGVAIMGEGHIRLGGTAETVIGELDGRLSARMEAVSALFSGAGLPVRVSENITGAIWTKFMVTIGLNALSALTGLRNGQIVGEPESFSLASAAVREAAAIAAALGVRLETDDPVEYMRRGGELSALSETSMLQDIRAGRMTEIEAMNGEIDRRGETLGIPAPVNAALAALIRLRERKRLF